MKIVCVTNDVEATTIQGASYDEHVSQRVKNEAIPLVLELYERFGVRATFFCVGEMIEKNPEIIPTIEKKGHEVACHGWTHDSNLAFDKLSYEQQVQHLTKAKHLLEKVSTQNITSFRAPALRVNEYTAKALVDTDFLYDSSISSQRMDAFMSLGSKRKMQWLFSPRVPYHTSDNNLACRGACSIVEVPVSAFAVPYIGTFIRIFPLGAKLLRWILYLETKGDNNKVVTLLFHPNELIERHESLNIIRRSKNPIVHFLTGKLRVWLKRRNFGIKAQVLIEEELSFWKNRGYEFCTINETVEQLNKNLL